MKMKKIAAAAMAMALIGGTVPFAGDFTKYSLTSHAADSEKISDSVLPSLPIVSQINTSVYKGEKTATFKMGGWIYNQGVVFNPSTVKAAEMTFDVTDTKTLSLKLGHVDNADTKSCEMKIYVDDVLSDTVTLTGNMTPKAMTLDVSKAKQLSFVIDSTSRGTYAIGDITSDTEKPAIAASRLAYKDMNGAMGSFFDTSSKISVYSGSDKSKSFQMNGRTYYEGLAFSATGSTTLNVDGCKKLTCSLGHIDNTEAGNGTFNFYIDDKLVESKEVTANSPVQNCEIEIPKDSSCLRIELTGSANYGVGDIILDSLAVENKHTAPAYTNVKELITSAYNLHQGTKYFGDSDAASFNVNGRSYYEGIVFTSYTSDTKGTATFNTENCNKLSFSVGKLDNANANKAVLHVYYDNVEKEKVEISAYDNAKKVDLDVSAAAEVKLVVESYSSKYALMDITADKLTVDVEHKYPKYDSVKDLLKNAYDYPAEARIYADGIETDSFKMCGRTYYEGVTITQGGVDNGLKVHNICMNVEDINTISWDAGFISDADYFHDSVLNVYIDNELKEKIELTRSMPIKECSYDVSKATTIRLEFNINSYSAYGIGNIRADKKNPSIDTVIPEYKNVGELLKSGYNRHHVEVYDGSAPDTRFITIGDKQYPSGITLSASGSSDQPFISFNTENVDGLKFTIGLVSYVYSIDSSSTLSVYKDNKLVQKISMSSVSEPVTVAVDTKDTDVVRLIMEASGSNTLGVVDVEMGEFDPSSLTTTAATTTSEPTTTTTAVTPISAGEFGDINGDGIIDGRDATALLTFYAKTSTGYTGTLRQFIDELNGVKTDESDKNDTSVSQETTTSVETTAPAETEPVTTTEGVAAATTTASTTTASAAESTTTTVTTTLTTTQKA